MRLKHTRCIAVLLAGLAQTPLVQAVDEPGTDAVARLSAAQVVERHVAARGGLKAWQAIQTLSWTGSLQAGTGDTTARSWRYTEAALLPNKNRPGTSGGKNGAFVLPPNIEKPVTTQQVELPFVMEMQRPRKSRLEIQFAGKTAVQVYDGTQGWKLRPFLNRDDVQPFSADENRAQAATADLDGLLIDYQGKGSKVALDGIEPVEGSPAYRLAVTTREGSTRHVWIDARTFLDVRVEGSPRWMDGKPHTVWVAQRDFRAVQGVVLPFQFETSVDGYPDSHKMQIQKAEVNPRLDPAVFRKPGG